MKFALVSHVLPPSRSGQAMVLYRLLKDLPPQSYCLISQGDYMSTHENKTYTDRLAGRYYCTAKLQPGRIHNARSSLSAGGVAGGAEEMANRLLRRVSSTPERADKLLLRLAMWRELLQAALAPSRILLRGRQIARILERESCRSLVACSGDLLNLPAGYLASRLVGISFYAYLFDDYVYQWYHPWVRWLARKMEGVALRRAAGIIAPNEFLQMELRRRQAVEATVIHNPCDVSAYAAAPQNGQALGDEGFKIVYTGAVYRAHYDAFHNLLAAIRQLGPAPIQLHLYTDQSPQDLAARGIHGPVVYHPHQPLSVIPRIQQDANMLFLPLAFDSPFPELINTSAPGKTGEYLAAGRPILVHAPPDSFLAWYFHEHKCGLVVADKDPGRLARALQQLLADADLRHTLGTRARERAKLDFSVQAAQARFAGLMNLEVSHSLPRAVPEKVTQDEQETTV